MNEEICDFTFAICDLGGSAPYPCSTESYWRGADQPQIGNGKS